MLPQTELEKRQDLATRVAQENEGRTWRASEWHEELHKVSTLEKTAEIMPEKLQQAQRRTAQAAAELERREAEEARLFEAANAWNGLLSKWERQSTLVTHCTEEASALAAVGDEARQLVDRYLSDPRPGVRRELLTQVVLAKSAVPMFKAVLAQYETELAEIEGDLLSFARRHGVEKRCLPEHLQKGLA